jgi:uncharacterized protein (TIGR02270 family)
MPSTSTPRPIGFHPREISAMFNQEVIDQHAEEAAFLWTQRDHAVESPAYALRHLARLDERVEAHVDGLRVAGEAGWSTAVAALSAGPGEAFAASVLAFESGDAAKIDMVLNAGCSAPPLERGLISALGWTEPSVAVREARKLVDSAEPETRRAGIAAMAIRRIDPGPVLEDAILSEHPRLASRALRAGAELGRIDLLARIRQQFSGEAGDARFWAAWSAVRLGERYEKAAFEALMTAARPDGANAERAVDICCRAWSVPEAHTFRQQLAARPETARLAAFAAGAIGDPAVIPDLIAQMEDAKLARAAGAAFSMITGADLAYEDLDRRSAETPDAGDDEMISSPDDDLPLPSPEAVRHWWSLRAGRFASGARYLLGRPVGTDALREVLAVGRQNQREAAALELALREPAQALFETRERGGRQRKKVAQWTS